MQQYEDYTKERKKNLGAFYTPKDLADYLARATFSLCKFDLSIEPLTVLDPATGDSALLLSLSELVKPKLKIRYCGIDVEKEAIERSSISFTQKGLNASFFQMDALFPYTNKSSEEGWSSFLKSSIPNGVDIIVSNPPWGADKSQYNNLGKDFTTATGQFDIYDLFIETSIKVLKQGGCFGLIVPDSIYCEEHTPIRKFLLENTTIRRIVRLGEGIFPNINIAVSLIFGIKKKSNNTKVICSHLTNALKNDVINNKLTIKKAVDSCAIKVPQKLMLEEGYSFLTDIKTTDSDLLALLRQADKVENVAECHRGIEISKKGHVYRCLNCNKWFPQPRAHKDNDHVKCPHCNAEALPSQLELKGIIKTTKTKCSKPIIVGEDISRYYTESKSNITTGIDGINYKEDHIYEGSKVLVRKTGVGITVGIDYDNCLTNQVVYILKRKASVNSAITNEVILAILNSRIITYYIIKTLGSNGWKSNAYLTQTNVMQLPFPQVNGDEKTYAILNKITKLIKPSANDKKVILSDKDDAELEYLVSELYGLNESDYDIIFQSIKEVQQMIPFQRLLNITKEDIFKNGI